ncbi:hypothetical protein ACWEOW_11260 [Monashia sp. NPDC004114]
MAGLPPNLAMVPRPASKVQFFPSVIPVQDVEPPSSAMFWVDTSTAPPTLKGWDGAAWVAVGGGGGGVPTSRTISAGTGLTGGGDLTANRTLTLDLEYVQDQVAAMLVAGSNITLTYNDPAGTITVASSAAAGLHVPQIAVAAGAYCVTDPYRSAFTTGPAGNVGGEASGYQWSTGRTLTVDSVTLENTSAGAASTFSRFMIYSALANGKIDALVWDSGQEAQDVTGIKTLSTSLTINPGTYWTISVRAAGGGTAANYRAFTWNSIPWGTAAADTGSNRSFDLGAVSSTSTPPSTWSNTTYSPQSRAPIALWLHTTGVS